MPDASVWVAVVTGASGALGALGTVALTNRAAERRERWQMAETRAEARRQAAEQAFGDLLGAAERLRLEVDISVKRPWEDVFPRLTAVQEGAAALGDAATRVAVLLPGRAGQAARELAREGYRVASAVVASAQEGSGQIRNVAGFEAYDRCREGVYAVVEEERGVLELSAADKTQRRFALVRRKGRVGRREGTA
ncbi:hypothetical protein [Bailinhaonella thermotolerans]|uniref:hypothetical protein n=1 Tax=Bailinhaonella thermotolerans TaxID=1070861 RepID=UPI00192A17D0|nr:hypothetical protein [Bailinhaonella thermotolerans]